MGERISMSSGVLYAHADSLAVGAEGFTAKTSALRARMTTDLDPCGGGPDAEAIQQDYYANAIKILDATHDAAQACRDLAETIRTVGDLTDSAEAARVAAIQKVVDGLQLYPPVNYDPTLGSGVRSIVSGPVGKP